jgi:hypothetical protein
MKRDDMRDRRTPEDHGRSEDLSPARGGGVKASLRGKDYDAQVQMLAPPGTSNSPDPDAVLTSAAHGITDSGTSLPHGDRIQKSFGLHDLSTVAAHSGPSAVQATRSIGAKAYATGNHVVLGRGVNDLHTVAHEAAHVVQQRQGVALQGKVGRHDDAYEQQANAVADRVSKGESAEDLLGQPSRSHSSSKAVQRSELDERAETNSPSREGSQPGFFDVFVNGFRLPPADREWLERETGDRMGVAFTKYVDACNAHIAALRSAATFNRDIFLVIADVALALLAPGGGKALAAMLNALPVKSPKLLYAAALPILDNAGLVVSATFTGAKRALGMAFERGLQQPGNEAFVESLMEGTSVAMQDARAGFRGRSDAEMAVLCSAYDARIATKSAYSARIGGLVQAFKRDVEAIGTTEFDAGDPVTARAPAARTRGIVAIQLDDGKPALVQVDHRIRENARKGKGPPELLFVGFIDPEMSALAQSSARRCQPGGIQVVPAGAVRDLPPLPPYPVGRL